MTSLDAKPCVTTGFVVKYLRVRTSTNLDSPVLYSNSWWHFGDLLPFRDDFGVSSPLHYSLFCALMYCSATNLVSYILHAHILSMNPFLNFPA